MLFYQASLVPSTIVVAKPGRASRIGARTRRQAQAGARTRRQAHVTPPTPFFTQVRAKYTESYPHTNKDPTMKTMVCRNNTSKFFGKKRKRSPCYECNPD